MKRVIAALLSLSLCFALCSCKSQEATNVDNLICSIGEVTLDSGEAIRTAESAVEALSEKGYEHLEHLEELRSARARYAVVSSRRCRIPCSCRPPRGCSWHRPEWAWAAAGRSGSCSGRPETPPASAPGSRSGDPAACSGSGSPGWPGCSGSGCR